MALLHKNHFATDPESETLHLASGRRPSSNVPKPVTAATRRWEIQFCQFVSPDEAQFPKYYGRFEILATVSTQTCVSVYQFMAQNI